MQPQPNGSRSRRSKVVLYALLVLAIVAACWQYGLVGSGIRKLILPRVLPPLAEPAGLAINRMLVTKGDYTSSAGKGLKIILSPAYVVEVLKRSPLPHWLLPPGLLVEHFTIYADLLLPDTQQPISIPCVLKLDSDVGQLPHVRLRMPTSEVNMLLGIELADDWHEREEYILGHYELDQRIWFHSLTLESMDMPRQQADTAIRFRLNATGRLRYWFEDGPIKARLTAKVEQLTGYFVFNPMIHDDGIGFDYHADVETLDIRVDNMAPWLERRVAKALAKSMERSQNKPRKKAKMARHRVPAWLPLDVDLLVELTDD